MLQAVDGAPYNESDPEHLAMAGRFVADLHTATTARRCTPVLPEAGPQRYLRHLLAARARLQECLLISHSLDHVARRTLERVVGLLDRVETGWHAVGARCDDAPLVLVHGDFRPKNVFVRHDGGGLVAFDWETAGWGPPPADLTKADVATYWRTVCDEWGTVSLDTVLAWEWVGRVFQALAAIDWSSANLTLEATADQSESISNVQVLGEGLSEVWTRA